MSHKELELLHQGVEALKGIEKAIVFTVLFWAADKIYQALKTSK